MAQDSAEAFLQDLEKDSADKFLRDLGGPAAPNPYAQRQDFLQTKPPTDRTEQPTDLGYGRAGRALGRGGVESVTGSLGGIEALVSAVRGTDRLGATAHPMRTVFDPQSVQGFQSSLGLRPEERTGSGPERLMEMVGHLPATFGPMGVASKTGAGIKLLTGLGALQSSSVGFSRGYFEAKGKGADEETAFKQALGTGVVEGAVGAASSLLPARAMAHFAKANALSGGALANAALSGAINAGGTMASQAGAEAIAVYLETLPPEERSSFLEILTNPDVIPSALVGIATQGALEYSSRSTAKFHEALGLQEQLAQAEGQANTQIAGAEFAKGVEKRAQVPQLAERNPLELPQESPPAATTETPLRPLNQYVGLEGAMMRSGLTEAELALRVKGGELPVKMESRREPLFLLSDIERLGREIPSLEPAPPKAPPGVDPRYARQQAAETDQEPARPSLEAEKAPAAEQPAGAATEAPAQPGGRIKPETRLERADREFGNTMSAMERIVRDKLQSGPERKEPTYLGVEGMEEKDPVFRALRQAGVESEAHRGRARRFYEPQTSALREIGITDKDYEAIKSILGDTGYMKPGSPQRSVFDAIVHARHQGEREAKMATINRGEEGLAGMSKEQAQAIADLWKDDPRMEKVNKAIAIQDRMLSSNLQREVGEGLRTPEEAAKMRSTYQFYAPLKTNVEGEPIGRGARGIRGQESQRALGRTTLPDSPMVFSQVNDLRTTARIERNRTLRSAADFVRNTPELGEVVPASEFKKRGLVLSEGDESTGRVYDPFFVDRNDAIPFKEGGQQYAIVFKPEHQPIAAALSGSEMLTPGSVNNKLAGAAFRGSNAFSRFTKRVTSKDNPLFWPFNLIALDTPTTFARQWSERGLRFAIKEQVNAARLIPDLVNNGPVMKRFRAAGAEMPVSGVEDYETLQKRIDSQIKAGDKGGAFRHFVEAYERAGSLFENVHKLSVFDLATRSKENGGLGMSDDRGALASNEANVNFSRRGQLGPMIEAGLPYYQSGFNATRSFTKALRGKHSWQPVVAAATFGYLLDQYNRTVAGTDENGENRYDKIDPDTKETYYILMGPDGNYAKMPKAPGWAWFTNVGMYASAASSGQSSVEGVSADIALNLVKNLSPLNVAPSPEGGVTQLIPAPVRPLAEAALNVDRYGNEIVPENQSGRAQLPANERYRKNVSPLVKGAVDATSVEVSPSLVEHVLKGYLPGLLTEMGRGLNVGVKAAKGQAVAMSEVPFARRLVGEENPYFTVKKFRENQELVNTSIAKWNALTGPEKGAYRREHPEIGLKPFMEQINQGLREAASEEVEQRLRAQFNRRIKATLAKRGESVSSPPPLVENK